MAAAHFVSVDASVFAHESARDRPTASRLTVAAPRRYAVMTVGDAVWTSAMLSKPALVVSAGRNVAASISMPSRSRIAREYSARFSRWKGRHPGSFARSAEASARASRVSTKAARRAASGRLDEGGGIAPVRTFRIIFSRSSAPRNGEAASNPSRIRSPFFVFSLWHPEQKSLTRAFCSSLDSGARGRAAAATAAVTRIHEVRSEKGDCMSNGPCRSSWIGP